MRELSLFGSETIVWDDNYKRNNVLWKAPRNIRMNDNIVVREDEFAVFYRDGKALMYIDRPDRYALTSQNAPIIGALIKFLTGVQQQAEVFYIQRRNFDGKFGTKDSFVFEDKDFGMVDLRAFGEFRYRVSDPGIFITQFVGTFNATTNTAVEERIRDQVVLLIINALGNMKDRGMRVTQIPANLTNIEQIVIEKSKTHFAEYGIEISKLSGLNIPLPPELKAKITDVGGKKYELSQLGAQYGQVKAFEVMGTAAANPGGAGAAMMTGGMGMGAGLGMGAMMMGAMQPQVAQPMAAQPQTQQGGRPCPKCGAMNPPGMKFCGSCGGPMEAPGAQCPKCNAVVPAGMKFCGSCGNPMGAPPAQPQGLKCVGCGSAIPQGMRFCPNCGKPAGG